MTTLPPYLTPINNLSQDADEQIRRAGELARALVAFDLVCLEHGEFKWNIQEEHIERESTRHRVSKACWHEITAKQHTVEG